MKKKLLTTSSPVFRRTLGDVASCVTSTVEGVRARTTAVVIGTMVFVTSVHGQTPTTPSEGVVEIDKGAVLSGDDDERPGVILYERMVAAEPGNPEAHQLLGLAYAQQQKWDAARREIAIAIRLTPDGSEMFQALALIEEQSGNFVAAEDAINKALAIHGNVEYRLDRARIFAAAKRSVDAEAEYDSIATEFATNRDVQLLLAETFKDVGRFEDAHKAYDRALAISPNDVDVLVAKATAYADKADLKRAVEVLMQARTVKETDAEVHYNLGIVYFRMRKYEPAVTAFKRAVELKDDFARAHNNLGVALDKMEAHEDALKALDKAVVVDPDFADAHFNRGLQAFRLRKWPLATEAFERALALDPDYADAKFYLGEVYYQTNDPSKALAIYKQALRMRPNDAATHRRLGDIYLEKGELDLAIGEYWGAVDADDRIQENAQQLMRVLIERNGDGDVRRAIKVGETALEKDPRAIETRLVVAEAHRNQGRALTARKFLEEGIKLAPLDARTHAAYGTFLLEEKGMLQEADKAFKKALDLKADTIEAHYGIARIALDRGDREVAITSLNAVLKINPSYARARADLGCTLLYKGDRESALKELKRTTEDDAGVGQAWYCLGRAQIETEDVKGAETSFQKAVNVEPRLAEAHYALGKISMSRGDKKSAKKSFAAAVKARSDYDAAVLELEKLRDVN